MSVDRPWRLDAVLRLLLGLAAGLCMGGVVLGALRVPAEDQFSAFVVSNLTLHGGIFFFVHLLLQEHRMSWSAAFGFGRPRGVYALLLALGVAAVALPCTWLLGQLSVLLMTAVHLEPAMQPAVTTIQQTSDAGRQIYMAGVAISVVPVAEELLFRGVLYPAIKGLGWPRAALWGTALLFGAVHFTLMSFIPLTVLGLLLTWLYEKTGNLLAPIFTHGLFNLANLFLMMLARSAA
jgi:membrane protease YdiL (CAAX protease family)